MDDLSLRNDLFYQRAIKLMYAIQIPSRLLFVYKRKLSIC